MNAASGGFVAASIYSQLEWDFKLPMVGSINISVHKYGLVYAGVGWTIWKSAANLREDLIFHINYLGSDQPTFPFHFSKGFTQIIAQYYQFIRLGFHGYKSIIANCAQNAKMLTECFHKSRQFNILSKPVGIPVVAFSLNKNSNYGYDVYAISDHLRRFGWIVPPSTMVPHAQHVLLLRIVVREEFNKTLCDRFVHDILFVLQDLDHLHHPQFPVPTKILTENACDVQAEAEVQIEAIHDSGDVVVHDGGAPSMADASKQLLDRSSYFQKFLLLFKFCSYFDAELQASIYIKTDSTFVNQGLSFNDLIALAGTHTIGQARCTKFPAHIYNDSIHGFKRNFHVAPPPDTGQRAMGKSFGIVAFPVKK